MMWCQSRIMRLVMWPRTISERESIALAFGDRAGEVQALVTDRGRPVVFVNMM